MKKKLVIFRKKNIFNKNIFFICSLIIIFSFSCFFYITKANQQIKVPIILYHNITTDSNLQGNPLLNITPENFQIHMQTLKDNGWNTISFEDYYNYVENNIPLPTNPIIITFDDGYSSVYTYAFPILKNLQMQATSFVITSRMGFPAGDGVTYPHFSWVQAKEMDQSKVIDIESHSDTHVNMSNTQDTDKIQVELRRSKYLIEQNLNKDCTVFAFPYGGKTDYAQKLGLSAGYKMLCKVGDEGANAAGDDLTQLKRITIHGDETPDQLLKTITKNLM